VRRVRPVFSPCRHAIPRGRPRSCLWARAPRTDSMCSRGYGCSARRAGSITVSDSYQRRERGRRRSSAIYTTSFLSEPESERTARGRRKHLVLSSDTSAVAQRARVPKKGGRSTTRIKAPRCRGTPAARGTKVASNRRRRARQQEPS
jgi:hypothetical protein